METTLEIVHNACEVYCLCFQNERKKENMTKRWNTLGIPLHVYDGVPHTDARLQHPALSSGVQRLWSVTYGHLDMIQQFVDTNKEFGLFCEDDILIHQDLVKTLPYIMSDMNEFSIDFLLLGYMTTVPIQPWMGSYELIHPCSDTGYQYHQYPQDQWGVHLYMMSRKAAIHILHTYDSSSHYARSNIHNPDHPFSPDWTISKCPGIRSALIAPMLAVEDGQDSYEHYAHDGQYQFHRTTFLNNYREGEFL